MLKHFLKSCAGILLSLSLLVSSCEAGIDFDGTDDLVDLGSSGSWEADNTGSISTWIYIDVLPATDANMKIFAYGGANVANPGIGSFEIRDFTASGAAGTKLMSNFQAEGASPMTSQYRGSTNLSVNTWYHVVLTSDGTTSQIYLNGTAETMVLFGGTNTNGAWFSDVPCTATDKSSIGAMLYDGSLIRYFNGQINEVAIWNVALTQTEITLLTSSRIKNMPLQIRPSSLRGYWPMDEGTHGNSADLDTAWDMSGNGNNGNPDNGANNTGLTWAAEQVLSYSSPIIMGQ